MGQSMEIQGRLARALNEQYRPGMPSVGFGQWAYWQARNIKPVMKMVEAADRMAFYREYCLWHEAWDRRRSRYRKRPRR